MRFSKFQLLFFKGRSNVVVVLVLGRLIVAGLLVRRLVVGRAGVVGRLRVVARGAVGGSDGQKSGDDEELKMRIIML